MAGRQARLVIEGGKVRACVVDEEAVAAEKEREATEERREERAEQRAAARRERERQRERAARERRVELDRRRQRQEYALAQLRRRQRRRLYDSESEDEGGFTSSSTDSSESTIPALGPAVSESGSEPRGRSLGEEEERSSDESDGGTSLSSFCTSGDGTESGDSSIDYGCDLAARQLREK